MNKRILVVDDDPVLRSTVSQYLRARTWQVDCASDRDEAETLLARYMYSVVLADLALAEQRFEGLNLLETVSHYSSPPKVIAMTGYATADVEIAALRRGADRFIRKPLALSELERTVAILSSDEIAKRSEGSAAAVFAKTELLNRITADGGIRSYVQPIFRIREGEHCLAGVECLSRGPEGSLYEPAEVLFEYTRRKNAEPVVDCKCIALALRSCRQISSHLRLSLNVHASTLGRMADFARWLTSTAAVSSVPLSQITMEIVEHGRALNPHGFLENIAALRSVGVRIALDDIGLGYSNYGILVQVHPDYFKMDRYFVDGCHSDKYRRAVLASVAQLARDIGGEVVAEGVDSRLDLGTVLSLGITLIQGYLFCSPVPSDEFSRELLSADGLGPCLLAPAGDCTPQNCPLGGMGLCIDKSSSIRLALESRPELSWEGVGNEHAEA